MSESMQGKIEATCAGVARLLVGKNKNYGNSALEPVRVFAQVEPDVGIYVRLDDKLSRIRNTLASGQPPRRNDVVDVIGYLVLYCIKRDWTDCDDLID